MYFLLYYWIVIIFAPKNIICELISKNSNEFDAKIWEWHNSTLGIEILMWKKFSNQAHDDNDELVEKGRRVKRYNNQVGSGGSTATIWRELLPLLVSREKSAHEHSSQSVWGKLLTLMGLSGQFPASPPLNSPQVTPWRKGEKRGNSWHWRSEQGNWIAWSWSKNMTQQVDVLNDAVVEGGGLWYEDLGGHVNSATWSRDTSGTITWQVQGQVDQRGGQDMDHTKSRVSREAENVQKASLPSDQSPRSRLKTDIQQVLQKALAGSTREDQTQNTAVGRKHWLEWIIELLARTRRPITQKPQTPEEIDF